MMSLRDKRERELDEIANTFGDPILLAQDYIEPNCQQFNPADYDDESSYIVKELIFSRIEAFFSSTDKDNQLFLLADAGMGKTSALVMLKLAYFNSFWPKNYNCELIKLGKDSLTNIDSISSKRKTILLLDALDEDPLAWGRIEDRITDILIKTINFKKVIITCRTQFFSGGNDPFDRRGRVEVSGHICPAIYLSLFSNEQIHEYCLKRFKNNPAKIKRVAGALSNMMSLKCRPMLLAHVEDILESKQKKWNVYSVYDALITSWLNREHWKMRKFRGNDVPLPKELRLACSLYASELFKLNKMSLSSAEFTFLLKNNKILKKLEHMDIGGRSLLNKNSDGEFRFSHLTIQEFLLVETILSGSHGYHLKDVRASDQIMEFIYAYIKELTKSERTNVSLRMLDFSTISLANADLSYVGLQGASIRNIQAKNVKFLFSDLRYTDFSKSDLEGADFTGANLLGVKFDSANLRGAIFSGDNLIDVDFSNAEMSNVQFLEGKYENCNFNESNLESAAFNLSTFQACDFELANLQMTYFKKVEFLACIFDKVNFSKSSADQVKFSSGSMQRAKCLEIYFENARFFEMNIASLIVDERTFIKGEFLYCKPKKLIDEILQYSTKTDSVKK